MSTNKRVLPYGRQSISEADIAAVTDVLRSERLTCGSSVSKFELEFARVVNAKNAVSLSSGTAALHAAMFAIDVGPSDEVIVPAITFAASANCVLYRGATPVFADVLAGSLLIDSDSVEAKITSNTKAIITVDYAGQPCDYERLRSIAKKHNLWLVNDACHSLGARYQEQTIGSVADISTFSFHPVKAITTGEGGMLTTDDGEIAKRVSRFRTHGINTNFDERQRVGSYEYQIQELGYNYRLTDIQAALGYSQLKRLNDFVTKRQALAAHYDSCLSDIPFVSALSREKDVSHAYHLYVVKLDLEGIGISRQEVFERLRENGVSSNVHYAPVYYHPLYVENLGYSRGLCPIAEVVYEQILTLPLFVDMEITDVNFVAETLATLLSKGS